MLMTCPECEGKVSDKAAACPHCGYPVVKPIKTAENIKPHSPHKPNRRRRLPNGFGQISEIKGRNLRNPFRAMVTVGKDKYGQPISKPLKPTAYFRTYNEAYEALVEYNRNPYDLNPAVTVGELYERWLSEYEEDVKNPQSMKSAWKYCTAVRDMPVKDVRARHVKGCMEEGTAKIRGEIRCPTAQMKNLIKILFNKLLDYALEYELTDKNYSRMFRLPKETVKEISVTQKEHMPFTDDEMEKLWLHVNDTPFADTLLVQCYTGWRPQEMGLIEIKDVDLEYGSIKGGMKTDAGKNRLVPIHPRVYEIVKRKYREAQKIGSRYLFNDMNARCKSTMLTYPRYTKNFTELCKTLELNINHRPHDGRKHFVTMAKKYNVDEYAIKYIVGHAINDITEKTYTEREFDWLKREIEKIK